MLEWKASAVFSGDEEICLKWTAKNVTYTEYRIWLNIVEFDCDNATTKKTFLDEQFVHRNANLSNESIQQSHEISQKWNISVNPIKSYQIRIHFSELIEDNDTNRIEKFTKILVKKPLDYQYLCASQIDHLMERAIKFCGNATKMVAVKFLTRCKDLDYWKQAMLNDVLETFPRTDAQGHASPLNYTFPGIFFFASAFENPIKSPFGTILKQFPPDVLLGSRPEMNFNFYFADIKCYSFYNNDNTVGENSSKRFRPSPENIPHYICIVVSQKGSEADSYFSKNLPPLNMESNAFLQVTNDELSGKSKLLVPNRRDPTATNYNWIELFIVREELRGLNWKRVGTIEVKNSAENQKKISTDCPFCLFPPELQAKMS